MNKLMVCSMTGFGSARYLSSRLSLNVEIKTVNSRFLDLSFKLPQGYSQFELVLADLVREHVKRGRVEVIVSRHVGERSLPEIRLDESLFLAYLRSYEAAYLLADLSPTENRDALVRDILRRKELTTSVAVEMEDIDEDEAALLKATVSQALLALKAMREREGEALAKEVNRLIGEVASVIANMQEQSQILPQIVREKLIARIANMGVNVDIDPQRLAQEVAYFADRGDVTEELARLSSHIDQVTTVIHQGGGRKMEFLLQEMGREVNTVGSKSQGGQLSTLVISAKGILEKIREQIQNIE